MKTIAIILLINVLMYSTAGQATDSLQTQSQNMADKLLSYDSKLTLGGYGEVHYNQPLNKNLKDNGVLDVHRMVVLLGYNFNSKVQFVSEIEFEHVSEVFIEQAFLQYKMNNYLNFRAGLMLIPMGIINEFHEPTTFNGVERPAIDTRIAPTTWRESGVGLTGNILPASMKYQLYLVNGFNGYDGEAHLDGRNALRNGRQKGAESYISSPNITGKIEYFGIRGLNAGLSGYFGKTQSKLYHGIDKDDDAAIARADSSVTGITMTGFDARYQKGGLRLRGQIYYTTLSNTNQYNIFTATDNESNDLGSGMTGYYLEAGYDLLNLNPKAKSELIVFTRYENYNTHFRTAADLPKNKAYDNQIITSGITFKLAMGAVVKADIQFSRPAASDEFAKTFNAGFGVMF